MNTFDKEIVEALERLFINDLPKIKVPALPKMGAYDFEGELADFKSQLDVYEDEATFYEFIKLLRILLVSVVLFSIMRVFFAVAGQDEIISSFHQMFTTFFFGMLFIMLHIETGNQSRILLFLAFASLWFSLW